MPRACRSWPRSFLSRLVGPVTFSLHGQRGDPADPLAEFAPTLAAVLALKQRAIAETGEEPAVPGRERVHVRVERTVDHPPGAGALPAVDLRIRRAAPVRPERAGGSRDEPAVRIGRVDGQGPGVASVPPGVRFLPAAAAVAAPGSAIAAGLVGAVWSARMPGQAVHVPGRLGAMIAERRAAVF